MAKLRITPNRSEQFGEMLRRGKMNQRRQRLFPPAPDFLYKAASFEPYNSAKYPEKPLATGAFCPDGVKNSLPELYQFLVGMVAEAVGFEPTCPLGQPHFECGSLRPLRYASKKGICGEQDNPDARIALFQWRCHPDLNRGMKVLQTFALPLGYGTQ